MIFRRGSKFGEVVCVLYISSRFCDTPPVFPLPPPGYGYRLALWIGNRYSHIPQPAHPTAVIAYTGIMRQPRRTNCGGIGVAQDRINPSKTARFVHRS